MISMFAIPNCDTVKKARHFLEQHHIAYEFIDFKKTAPSKQQIKAWSDAFGGLPVNKKGLTYRQYKVQFEALGIEDQVDFLIANPSMIKRPILLKDHQVIAFGFDEAVYKKHLLGLSS